MSENNTEEGELFATDTSEAVTDSANDTDDQATESGSEQEQDALELEEPEGKTSTAEDNRQKQIKATAAKILTGELSLDTLPEDMKWMKKDLQPLVKQEVDVKAIIREEIEAEHQKKDFTALKSTLNEAGLTKDQKATLQAKYKALRQKNLSELDALQFAMEMSGVDLHSAALEAEKAKMRLPKSSTAQIVGELTMEQIGKLEEEHGYAGMKERVPESKIAEYNLYEAGQRR